MENEKKSPVKGAIITRVNPSDLVLGQKYLLEMAFEEWDNSNRLCHFISDHSDSVWSSKNEPIYTHEESHDTELEMLVNVAIRTIAPRVFKDYNEVAHEAQKLITACKNQLKGNK